MPGALPAGAQAAAAQPANPWSGWAGTIARFALMWAFMTWMKSGKPPASQNGTAVSAPQQGFVSPMFHQGQLVDMYVFLSEKPYISQYDVSEGLIWSETGIALSQSETRKYSYYYEPSEVSDHQISCLHRVWSCMLSTTMLSMRE